MPRVIAEVKLRSPSAGQLRPRRTGDVQRFAQGYERAGASAVSVLCDGPGFGGSPLDLRRAARAVGVPILFKEFVLDEVQLELAHRVGAHMVLLLVCALEADRLKALVRSAQALGLAPVVEAAGEAELQLALATGAEIVGVNARNLRTFEVDPEAASRVVEQIPRDRIAVRMSGVSTRADLGQIAAGRADAILIGESLMRAPDPGARLAQLLK